MGKRGKIGGFGPAVWMWWLVGGPVDCKRLPVASSIGSA